MDTTFTDHLLEVAKMLGKTTVLELKIKFLHDKLLSETTHLEMQEDKGDYGRGLLDGLEKALCDLKNDFAEELGVKDDHH